MENSMSFPHSNTTNKQQVILLLSLKKDLYSSFQDYQNLLYSYYRIYSQICIAFSGRVSHRSQAYAGCIEFERIRSLLFFIIY